MDNQTTTQEAIKTKFCKHCGAKIPEDAVICTTCGRQFEEIKTAQPSTPNIVINNANSNTNTNTNTNVVNCAMGRAKNKWVAILLCVFLGYLGGHKFYEGKFGMGLVYMFTCGLFFIGIVIDFLALLAKPNPYYV